MEPVTMSVRSTSLARTATESLPALQRAVELAFRPVRFLAFWVATLLPFTYLPLLATGVVTTHRVAFAALVCLNAVAFVAGHGYKRPE
ncbi:hypothetical protein DU500_10020 [Haloplanus rubicundus]|uniref:Uncharacterized protein n=1 Tax=Haloplanus rubicundus TaxID=1547898 RepID=A0A345E3G3_9EURY|nr:hypothetical protein [Haloplanus rubicundus]AXG06735.1 hypothetical protein DU500_10020 [Haloplanus rubicundus]AXG10112.1 hypothetical protein DU484_09770 [Haloplanus rubicundus]